LDGPFSAKPKVSTEPSQHQNIEAFVYQLEDDKLSVGDKKDQTMYINDALTALKSIFQDVERRISKSLDKYPKVSERDFYISHTIAKIRN
jgi:hypothetical protein